MSPEHESDDMMILINPPRLTAAQASLLLDVLHELTAAFENHYFSQLYAQQQHRCGATRDIFGDDQSASS